MYFFPQKRLRILAGKTIINIAKIYNVKVVEKMRIVRTDKVQSIYGNQSLKRAEMKTGVTYAKDSVVFSNFAKEMQLASKAVKDAPEVRTEKVDQLKAQIESGRYNVSASQIAEKILGF